jgi:phospholipase/carboxylesterase
MCRKAIIRNRPASIAVMLHGAGAKPDQGLSLLRKFADDKNIILIAPASRASTWDIMANESFNTDVIFIDQALALAFNKFAIDPSHIAIGGFSDGASYALCIGLSNGDLFTHIIAFSPGFVHTIQMKGKPAIFISHGVKDDILPVDCCSRRIIPPLQGVSGRLQGVSGGA